MAAGRKTHDHLSGWGCSGTQLEGHRASSSCMLSHGRDPGGPVSRSAPCPTPRPGALGLWGRPGQERLRSGSGDRALRAGRLAHRAAVLARMAARWPRQTAALSAGAVCERLLCALVPLAAEPLAGARAAAGDRCHHTPGPAHGRRGQRRVPQPGLAGRLANPAGQSPRPLLAAPARSADRPGLRRAAWAAGRGPERPRTLESTPVSPPAPVALASAAAGAGRCPRLSGRPAFHAGAAADAAGRSGVAGARGRAQTAGTAPVADGGRGVDGGPRRTVGTVHRPAAAGRRPDVVWPAHGDRMQLPRSQSLRLGLGAHTPNGSRAGRAALAGAGGGQHLGAGRGHGRGGPRASARDPDGPHRAAASQRLPTRPRLAVDQLAGSRPAAPLAPAPRTLADPAVGPADHLPYATPTPPVGRCLPTHMSSAMGEELAGGATRSYSILTPKP